VNQLRAVEAEAPPEPASSCRCSSIALGNRTTSAIDAPVDRCIHLEHGATSLSGHSTRTAVVTSRLAIADIAHLHHAAERNATTVSALVARIVHEHARDVASQTTDHDQINAD